MLTPSVIWTFIKLYIQAYTTKPTKVRLDLCNMCQLNCVKCYMRNNEEKIKAKNGFGYVNFETFRKFIDKNPFVEEIETSNDGEIFLNPDLNEIIKYAYKKNISLTALNGVNLNYLTEKTAEYLVKYQFKALNISIDGTSQETYSIYRRNGNFNKVIENIKLINKYKEKYKSQYPTLLYKFILFGHNEHEIEDAKKLAKKLNMEIVFSVNVATGYSPVINVQKIAQQTGIPFSNNFEKYLRYINRKKKNASKIFECSFLFKSPQIDVKGRYVGCCASLEPFLEKNVFEYGLINIQRDFNVIKTKAFLSNPHIQPSKSSPCYNCRFRKSIERRKKY